MNDRFKVRAWDGKKMLTHNTLELTRYMLDFGGNFGIMDLQNMLWSGLISGVTLMQCTGLKDKNGRLIYEGDTVEAWSQGLKSKGEIKQRIDGYWLMYPAFQSSLTWSLAPNKNGETSVEVIGNRWENPELMEGNNG